MSFRKRKILNATGSFLRKKKIRSASLLRRIQNPSQSFRLKFKLMPKERDQNMKRKKFVSKNPFSRVIQVMTIIILCSHKQSFGIFISSGGTILVEIEISSKTKNIPYSMRIMKNSTSYTIVKRARS